IVKSIAGIDLYGEKVIFGIKIDPTSALKLIRLSYLITNIVFLFLWMSKNISDGHKKVSGQQASNHDKSKNRESTGSGPEKEVLSVASNSSEAKVVPKQSKFKATERSLEQRVRFLKWTISGGVLLYIWSAFTYIATIVITETRSQDQALVLGWKIVIDFGNWFSVAWFLAPNVVAGNLSTLPTMCSPSAECAYTRLFGGKIRAGGVSSRFYCPTGCVNPIKCDTISSCPVGSTAQTSFTGAVSFIVLDLALACIYGYQWLAQKKRVRAAEQILPTLTSSPLKTSPVSMLAGEVKNVLAKNFQRSMNDKKLRMHFEMQELGFKLPNGKEVLKGVTGKIHAGRMTAIMGPSGAGKTTFMNVLCGKVTRTSGKLWISGSEGELQKYKKIVGFVPQEDTMHRELTVRENILHSARIRSPSGWTAAEVESHTNSVIQALNLSHVAQTLIGDGVVRGVSGGQRKRVNIGMEIAATPLCLFLDEPTSGLDSTSSLEVMDMLDKISKIGMTIVAVIHQPRAEIFNKFDDVLMIAPGGRTAYLGPSKRARSYFETMGYEFPKGSNDADILMDILSGQGINAKADYCIDDLVSMWEKYASSSPREQVSSEDALSDREFHEEASKLVQQRGASSFWQFVYCHNLSLIQQYRNFGSLVLEVFVSSFTGLVMGLALSGTPETYTGILNYPYTLLSTAPNLWLTIQLSLLVGLSIALAAGPPGVNVFANELPIYWRYTGTAPALTAASGHSPEAYYLAKSISALYRMTLASLHYCGILFMLATPIVPFATYFLGVLLMFFGGHWFIPAKQRCRQISFRGIGIAGPEGL
ncbi:hypothetical protein HDU91_003704, partial [Kappamyces sp. JEL0680]